MTIWFDNATQFATRDRQATADLVLERAVRMAIPRIRSGFRFDAEALMAKAVESADRILGRSS